MKPHNTDHPVMIREASNADIPDIQSIVYTVLREYGLTPGPDGKDADLVDIENYYVRTGGFFGVVCEMKSSEIVGTFGIVPVEEKTCELRKMYLLKKARGQGVGKFMLQFAIDKAKEKGFEKLILETISPLKEAISLYKKFGFTEMTPHEINERVDKAFELNL